MRTFLTVVILAFLVGCNSAPPPVQAQDCRVGKWFSETKKSSDGVSLWNGVNMVDNLGHDHMASMPYRDMLRYKALRGKPYVGPTDDGKCLQTQKE